MKVNQSTFVSPSYTAKVQNDEAAKLDLGAQNQQVAENKANENKVAEKEQEKQELANDQKSFERKGAAINGSAVFGAMDNLIMASKDGNETAKIQANDRLKAELKNSEEVKFNAQFLKDNAEGFKFAQQGQNIAQVQYAALLA